MAPGCGRMHLVDRYASPTREQGRHGPLISQEDSGDSATIGSNSSIAKGHLYCLRPVTDCGESTPAACAVGKGILPADESTLAVNFRYRGPRTQLALVAP